MNAKRGTCEGGRGEVEVSGRDIMKSRLSSWVSRAFHSSSSIGSCSSATSYFCVGIFRNREGIISVKLEGVLFPSFGGASCHVKSRLYLPSTKPKTEDRQLTRRSASFGDRLPQQHHPQFDKRPNNLVRQRKNHLKTSFSSTMIPLIIDIVSTMRRSQCRKDPKHEQ
jgi:hypothetical protein